MTDPTNTYEARAEMQADFELEDYMRMKKYMEYMEGFHLVNRSEVFACAEQAYVNVNDLGDDYEVSYWELAEEVADIADHYIAKHKVKFDEEWDIIDNPF